MEKRIGIQVREALERVDSGLATTKDAKLLKDLIVSTYRICSEQNPSSQDMQVFLTDLTATPEQVSGDNIVNFPVRGTEQR